MTKSHLLTLIFILFLALVNTAKATSDDAKFHNLTSMLLAQETILNEENAQLTSALKSPSKAFLFSAFIPGTGLIYTESKRGYLYIAAEIGLFASYFLTHRNASNLKDDYVQQVRDHVKFDAEVPDSVTTGFSTWNMEDFEHATMYDNWRGHAYTDNSPESDTGDPIPRVGKFYWDDIPESAKNQTRDSPDSQNRQVAFNLRKDSNDRFKLARTFLGLVIFNHLVSAIDARITAKLYNKRLISEKSGLTFKTIALPHSVEGRLEFNRRF